MKIEQEIDYEALAQNAMRGVVRSVLGRVAKSGLPGEHHFYIAFRTGAPGVLLSKRLMQKYPEEMTVVLQHRFWDLVVTDDRFEVKLTFDGIEERLSVPFAAIKVFFDPSVPYGLQFEDGEVAARSERQGRAEGPGEVAARSERQGRAEGPGALARTGGFERGRAEKKPRPPRRPAAEKVIERPNDHAEPPPKGAETAPANDAKVVKLDTFRKK